MYNRWVHLGLEIITVVFWMVCFALLASHTDDLGSLDAFILTFGTKYEAYYKKNVERYARLFVVATFAATAVSTFNFVLFLVSITVFGRELHRYQLSKLRATEDGVKLESMDHRKNLDLSSHGDDGRYHHHQPQSYKLLIRVIILQSWRIRGEE
ncbi:hypothetical protein CGCF415_v010303 [Colletotrichum fructicola]|nr:hypothetical protein CGCF415_v010303 [Colletotrichum fructicola]KAF4937063.1 hypothetical protein CGCF245_v006041 [Colletotrichum fructicola]